MHIIYQKLCYFVTRCTRPFQASCPQHTQMLIVIQGLFSQQKHAHSLSKKGTSSFSRYKIQTIHILELQIIFFISKYKIYIQMSYMFALYKMQIVHTNYDSTNSKPIQLDRSCCIHKWFVHKGEIQEKLSPRQQPILRNSTSLKFQSLGLNTRQSKKKRGKARTVAKEKVEAMS